MVCDPCCRIDCDSFETGVDLRFFWAAKELFRFRFSDVLLVALSTMMLLLTSALLLTVFLFSAFGVFDLFELLLLPGAAVSLFPNVSLLLLLALALADVALCPSSSEPSSLDGACVRIPRNQVGCLEFGQQNLSRQ